MIETYKVLVTTSGTGSRLKEITKNETNKALVEINGKAVVDHIVDLYDASIEIVVTLGYFGDKVREHLVKKYPDRKFTYVEVDKFEGPGSSLGYSMLCAKQYLDCPFIFHCNDTIVAGKIPSPVEYNWNGGSKGDDSEVYNTTHYSSFLINSEGNVGSIMQKGAENFDLFHIGLVGLKDHQLFWDELQTAYDLNPSDTSLNDVIAINSMLGKGIAFKAVEFSSWYDTGNMDGFNHTIRSLEQKI